MPVSHRPAEACPRRRAPIVVPALMTLLALALGAAPSATAAQQQPPRRPPADTLTSDETRALREASRDARALTRQRLRGDSATLRARGDSAAATAFADPEARLVIERARRARVSQDSALVAYRATTTQRISVGLGVRRTGLEKLLFRSDNVAKVAWRRDVGARVTPIGSRITVPMASKVDGDIVDAVSIPYFPGRETLWFPSSNMGVVRSDIDEREMIHPIAHGAEAHYRYATGDSIRITLGDGRQVDLREVRITARRPDRRLFVGSFWFDREGGQLVRAAYRMAVDLDIWAVASEESDADREFARQLAQVRDSVARARLPRETYVKDSAQRARAAARTTNDDEPPAWVRAAFRPAKAALDAITVEYGLHEGRFWLPRANSASAWAQVGFMRVPISIDEKFTYEAVNGDFTLAALPPTRAMLDSARRAAGADSVARDSVAIVQARSVSVSVSVGSGGRDTTRSTATRGDSVRIRQCASDSTWTRTQTRYEGTLRVAYDLPCDMTRLTTAPELPPLNVATGELFDEAAKDELLKALDLTLQPGWMPQMPTVRLGSDLVRYNRIEGLSVGVLAEQQLGAGYTVSALGRLGHADRVFNGELSLARSNSRRTVHAAVFHRLSAVNPEWSGPMTFGSSLPALLYTRDEGFYYRNFGVELGDRRTLARGSLDLRAFLERQWTAGGADVVNTFSLGGVFRDRKFRPNITAERIAVTGVAGSWMRAFGNDPLGLRLVTTTRGEAGTGTYEYARGSFEATASRPIGPVAAALTGAIGSSTGRVPFQRLWYMGGLRSVRGQLPGTLPGDAFWLGRAEVGPRGGFVRPVAFYDVGWAGSREAFTAAGPMRGAGMGMSFLDGLFRLDVAKGLFPKRGWRTDLYFEAPI